LKDPTKLIHIGIFGSENIPSGNLGLVTIFSGLSLLYEYQPWNKCLLLFALWIRVARWFVFKPKIPIWVIFGGPWNGKCWYILWSFGKVCGHLVYLMDIGNVVVIWNIFPRFGKLCKKNLATLLRPPPA
jgi:hypothetical protein